MKHAAPRQSVTPLGRREDSLLSAADRALAVHASRGCGASLARKRQRGASSPPPDVAVGGPARNEERHSGSGAWDGSALPRAGNEEVHQGSCTAHGSVVSRRSTGTPARLRPGPGSRSAKRPRRSVAVSSGSVGAANAERTAAPRRRLQRERDARGAAAPRAARSDLPHRSAPDGQVVFCSFGALRASSCSSRSAPGTPALSSRLRSRSALSSMPSSSAMLVSHIQTRKITSPPSVP